MEKIWESHSCDLSNLFLYVLRFLDQRYAKRLHFNGKSPGVCRCHLRGRRCSFRYLSFINGIARGICRPSPRNATRDGNFLSQQSVYSGHKRKNALKYQSLTTPDGLISHVFVSYSRVTNYWTGIDFKRAQHSGTTPIGHMYRVVVLFTNCITCVRGGNSVSDYFDLSPPSIVDYLCNGA
ncbi:hypothetical protein PHMEG_00013163 [Phytophthora megakarya]|uniref:Uncharacterized protein n=1 Tax=Phytophthora megakarya TaxID=4795 RepID=A0A225W8F1_9STRA|nr:hypothetical protein PHMEG_00013163 [Phytophthora megakarya]